MHLFYVYYICTHIYVYEEKTYIYIYIYVHEKCLTLKSLEAYVMHDTAYFLLLEASKHKLS